MTNYENTVGSENTAGKQKNWFSVDVAAVLLAVALAVLVRFGVLPHIGW